MVAIRAQRQTAPEQVGLVFQAKGRRGRIRQVRFDHAVEHAMVTFFLVAEAVRVLIRTYDPSAHRAAVVQRAGSIKDAAVIVPASNGAGGRAFAHHVDRCRGIARAGDQTGRATNHFHVIEHGQVRLHARGVARVRGGQAVVHDVVDIETA